MYGCENWTIKRAEHWRTDAFELWCWRRLLRVPWTARSNQSILKQISPEYSLEGLTLKLKFQYFGFLMQRADSLEQALRLGKIEEGGEGDDKEWDGWMASPTQWTWVWETSGSWWGTGKPGVLQSMGLQRVRHYLVIKEQQLYISNTFYSFLCHLKRPWCWERLRAGGEGDNRGWDGWMASPSQWTWVWVDSGSWWWTGRPGVLRFMGSQRLGHNWATELNCQSTFHFAVAKHQ